MAAQKSTGIDMEQNYVTVTLCIGLRPSILTISYEQYAAGAVRRVP